MSEFFHELSLMWSFAPMRQAIFAALLVGASAPAVGVFLVQRKLSLIGDGLGHMALAGVALGVLLQTSPLITAMIITAFAAAAVEFIRSRGKQSADIALSIMFYGGIALGVVLLARTTTTENLSITQFLFGAILTIDSEQIWQFGLLAILVVGSTTVLRKRLFAAANDPEYAKVVGLPVATLNILLAVLTSVTVVLSMRIIGLLLISALMILPNATGQILGRSFRAATLWSSLIGGASGVIGVTGSYFIDAPSGGTVVLVTIIIFLATTATATTLTTIRSRRLRKLAHHDHEHGENCGHEAVVHAGHVDYIHGDEKHVRDGGHWKAHP